MDEERTLRDWTIPPAYHELLLPHNPSMKPLDYKAYSQGQSWTVQACATPSIAASPVELILDSLRKRSYKGVAKRMYAAQRQRSYPRKTNCGTPKRILHPKVPTSIQSDLIGLSWSLLHHAWNKEDSTQKISTLVHLPHHLSCTQYSSFRQWDQLYQGQKLNMLENLDAAKIQETCTAYNDISSPPPTSIIPHFSDGRQVIIKTQRWEWKHW